MSEHPHSYRSPLCDYWAALQGSGDVAVGDVKPLDRALDDSHLTASLRASWLFFRMVLASAARYLDADSQALSLLARVAVVLEHSMAVQVETAVASWADRLLNQIRDAREDEWRRIALELHDRIGNAI